MKKHVILAFGIFILSTSSLTGQTRPNIIVIFTDDMGYADLGVQGIVDDVLTPNIDQLAAEGVRLTSGYITAPQCIPSRAGLLSGRYQQRFGLDHNGTIPMPLNEVLISQRLSEAGYVTGMTGKWHLEPNHQQKEWIIKNIPEIKDKVTFVPSDIPRAMKMPYYPPERGFQEYFYGPMYNVLANYDLEGNDLDQQWLTTEGYRLDNQTDAALTFIERNHEKPFFFYLPYFAPHVPLEATKKYLDRFPGEMPERRRYCLAMLSAIDDGVGKIKNKLQEYGIDDNTLMFFISDNGAPLKIHKEDKPISFTGGAWDGSLNDPWVGEKGMISEGGIRVPYIVSWPAVLPKGIDYDKPVISLDVAATAVALAGLEEVQELDGTNLIPYLSGEKNGDPHEALYWRFWDQSAIRMGDWKFLKAGRREFLFDLTSENHEKVNLIDSHPDIVNVMKQKLMAWGQELKNQGIPDGDIPREKTWYDHYFGSNSSIGGINEWNFDSLTNWTLNPRLEGFAQNGLAILTVKGADPYMNFQENVNINSEDYPLIKLKLKNNTNGLAATVYYQNDITNTWKFKSIQVSNNDLDVNTYTVNMTGDENWVGNIHKIRFDPPGSSGSLQLDYLAVLKESSTGFGDLFASSGNLNSGISIHPNPAKQRMYVCINTESKIIVYNSKGIEVYRNNNMLCKHNLPTKAWDAGVYVVKAVGLKGSFVAKCIVEN